MTLAVLNRQNHTKLKIAGFKRKTCTYVFMYEVTINRSLGRRKIININYLQLSC